MNLPKTRQVDGNEISIEFKDIVRYLKTDKKARYQGYLFFFREGFCWNNVLNPNARLLKVKLKQATVNDVGSMSLMSLSTQLTNAYFVALLNSNVIFDYYREFVNCTVNIQINDLRQIPIIIPTNEQLKSILCLFDAIYTKKRNAFISGDNSDEAVYALEEQMDNLIKTLYLID